MGISKNAPAKTKIGGKDDGKETISFTAHTFLEDIKLHSRDETLYSLLADMGDLYGHIKRTLFKDSVSSGRSTMTFKNDYLLRFGITARQFNAIRYDLDGNIRSAVEILKTHIEELEGRIASTRKWIKRKEARVKQLHNASDIPAEERNRQIHGIRFTLHNKKRKLRKLELKLNSLKKDLKDNRVRICFGSRALFRKQFNLEQNGYIDHEEWRSDWQMARESQSFSLGSKDETNGNQSCTLSADGTLRIRIPNHLTDKYSKYAVVTGVKYPYGQDIIYQALTNGQAITHRFVREGKGWYLHTCVDIKKPDMTTLAPGLIGCIGVDVNEKGIAVSESDRFGNLVSSTSYSACVKDKTSDQTLAIYGDICKKIVRLALATGKPISHEKLDFSKKKAALKEQGVSQARMLSGFAYSAILTILDRRAFKAGVQVLSVNPAYTSVIGKANYMSRYGITSHEAAAFVIARRAQRYSESPAPSRTASSLPVRNRGEHVWKYWHRQKGSRVRNSNKDSSLEGGPNRAPQAALNHNRNLCTDRQRVPSGHLPMIMVYSISERRQVCPRVANRIGTCVNQGENP